MAHQKLAALRETERLGDLKAFVSVASLYLSLPLFLLFWVSDILYVPERMWEFLSYRLLIVPVCALTYGLIKRSQTLQNAQATALFFIGANGLLLTLLLWQTGGITSPYVAGLNLLALAIVFFPLKRNATAIAIGLIYLPYSILCALSSPSSEIARGMAINFFFIFSTVVISSVIRFYLETLRGKELTARSRLHKELEAREAIIQRKTEQAVRLTELTRQFSPQVVQMIREGKTHLSDTKITPICTVFIDIVNSTVRMNEIDSKEFNQTITLFMDDVMRTFLKYDLTIDKFLGDGVLAFANAPVPHRDYVQRVVEAALTVRQTIASKQLTYQKLWRRRFEVRMGIAVGEANVGFYGTRNSVKSYTAIGKVVNLAARLCSQAQPSQILIEKAVATAVGTNYRTEAQPAVVLKGFETEEVKVLALLNEKASRQEEISLCPFGHGVLHLGSTVHTSGVLSCRECGYKTGDEVNGELLSKSAA